jgi:ubiquinone/menaquinone biosynthesis C-methylase UbiE
LADERTRLAAYYQLRRDPSIVSRYSYFHPGHLFRAQHLERDLLAALARHGFTELRPRRILDVGCGDGSHLRRLVAYGADPGRLVGVDILPERVATAREMDPSLDIRCEDASDLPFPDHMFDMVFQMTVFSLIFDLAKLQRVAAEISRVLRPGGAVISYDFRIARDRRQTRPIRSDELATLFPGFDVDARRVTLAPPIARALAGPCWVACELLELLAPLRSHELVVLRKP